MEATSSAVAVCADFFHLDHEGRSQHEEKTVAEKPRRNEPGIAERRNILGRSEHIAFRQKTA